MYRRLREEAPLYYNEPHDFYAREPVRRRPDGARRQGDVQLGARLRAGVHQGRHRDAARGRHLRGPAAAHGPPRPALPGLHAQEDARAGTEDPRVLRSGPRSAGRRRPLRLRRRSRCADADADDRHAARDPGDRSGSGPRTAPTRTCAPNRASRWTRGGRASVDGELLRRLHRLARRAPVRRHHDRAAAPPSSRTRPGRRAG